MKPVTKSPRVAIPASAPGSANVAFWPYPAAFGMAPSPLWPGWQVLAVPRNGAATAARRSRRGRQRSIRA